MVVNTIIHETQAQDSTIPIIQIRGMNIQAVVWIYIMQNLCSHHYHTDSVRRFFQSKLDESSLKNKGMYEKKVQKQRRRNHVMKVCLYANII